VTEIPSQEVEKPKLPDTPEVKKKEPETIQSPETEQEPQEIKEEPPGTETTEQQPMKRSADDLESRLIRPRKRKINYRRLSLEVGSITIMVVAGGYFLWSIYSYMSIKEPRAKTPPSKEVSGPALSGSSIPTNTTANVSIPQETNRRETEHSSVISKEKTEVVLPTPSNLLPSDAVIEETLEIGKIKGLLENIRQANLQKNIDLFISCYATDFKDREGKKKVTLAYWKKFDYLDLSYNLKNPSISSDTAKARVEWLIKISPKTGSQLQESKTILDVTLKKEEGGWKIKEVKQAG
jgi:ketosteroid isomerase-like protein